MSRTSYSMKLPEPVKPNTVWMYGPSYHRTGRVWVRKFLRADPAKVGAIDLWETQETEKGQVRKYTTDDLITIAVMTRIQPEQKWLDDRNRVCTIARPMFVSAAVRGGIFGWGSRSGYEWAFERADLGDLTEDTDEDVILANWTLIMSGGITKGAGCPLCGSPGLLLATSFDCSSSVCPNHRKPRSP